MADATGPAEQLFGRDGFGVLEVFEGPDALVIKVESTSDVGGSSSAACGPKPRIGCRCMSVIWRVWVGLPGCG